MTAMWGLGPTFPTKIVSYFLAQETGDWFSHFIEVPVLYRSRETVGDTGCELFVDYIQRKAVYLASGDNSVCAVPRNPWDVKSGFILTGIVSDWLARCCMAVIRNLIGRLHWSRSSGWRLKAGWVMKLGSLCVTNCFLFVLRSLITVHFVDLPTMSFWFPVTTRRITK